MDFLYQKLEEKYSIVDLQKIATKLDKAFRLNYFWNGWTYLEKELLDIYDIDYLKSKYSYREVFNNIIMKYGKTERVIKYYLSKEYIKNDDEVCLYEFNICNSRLDFGRINGCSYAYEIKTELDSTSRLKSQVQDYLKAFEYVNVVAHNKHIKKIKELVPRKVGIISYEFTNDSIEFNTIRECKLNKDLNKTIQLEMLTTEDLKYIIKENPDKIKIKEIPLLKEGRLEIVRKKFNKSELNYVFKSAIKHRQFQKWQHIKDNFDVLKPIEIQDAYIYNVDIKSF